MVFQAKKRDRARWKYADLNHDKQLNIEELTAFEIPEDFEYMKDFMLEEAYDSVDKNKDGKLSLKEFLGTCFFNKFYNKSGLFRKSIIFCQPKATSRTNQGNTNQRAYQCHATAPAINNRTMHMTTKILHLTNGAVYIYI